jgi:hypothetical protein
VIALYRPLMMAGRLFLLIFALVLALTAGLLQILVNLLRYSSIALIKLQEWQGGRYMPLKIAKNENAILSLLYHAKALVGRRQMTAEEISERLISYREMHNLLWTLKELADKGLVKRTSFEESHSQQKRVICGWEITLDGERHWDRLCGTTRKFLDNPP